MCVRPAPSSSTSPTVRSLASRRTAASARSAALDRRPPCADPGGSRERDGKPGRTPGTHLARTRVSRSGAGEGVDVEARCSSPHAWGYEATALRELPNIPPPSPHTAHTRDTRHSMRLLPKTHAMVHDIACGLRLYTDVEEGVDTERTQSKREHVHRTSFLHICSSPVIFVPAPRPCTPPPHPNAKPTRRNETTCTFVIVCHRDHERPMVRRAT